MNARVVIGQIQEDKRDEAVSTYRDSIVPAAKEQSGFKNAYLLTDPNSGKFISVTFWHTEAEMMSGESSGYYKEQIGKLAAIFTGQPTMEHYEVSVQE